MARGRAGAHTADSLQMGRQAQRRHAYSLGRAWNSPARIEAATAAIVSRVFWIRASVIAA